MAESVGSGFGRGVAPYVVLAAAGVGLYLFRDKIAGWIKSKLPGAGIPEAVGNGIGNLKQWPSAIIDWVTPDPVITGTPLPEGFGDPNQNIQGQFDWHVIPGGFGNAANALAPAPVVVADPALPTVGPSVPVIPGSPLPEGFGDPNQNIQGQFDWQVIPGGFGNASNALAPAPVVVADPALPTVGPSVPEVDNIALIVQQFAQKTGTTEQIAGAYLASRYGLSFDQFLTLARQEPTFAATVGLPGETYESLYLPNTPSGVYVGPNLNPLVPQGDSAFTTIYNPATGAMWSGSAESTSYLMGDSPEAAAWRARYL